MEEVEYLNELADQLVELRREIDQSRYMTPTNRAEQLELFLEAWDEGRAHNPQFEYESLPTEVVRRVEQLRDVIEVSGPWTARVAQDLDQTHQELTLLRSRDPGAMTEASMRAYGPLSPEAAAEARSIVAAEPVPVEPRELTAGEAAALLRDALARVGLDRWRVTSEQPIHADMSVSNSRQEVRVRPEAMFSPGSVRRLLVHEIGTHVFRTENGSRQPIRLLGVGLIGYMATEEGLAAHNEERAGVSSPTVMRKYALRVLATTIAISSPFSEVAETLAGHLTPLDVFSMVTRVKRGFTDTGVPGAHVKDKVYLEGFLAVREAMAADPSTATDLMMGKISLDQLEDVRTLEREGLVDRQHLLLPDLLS